MAINEQNLAEVEISFKDLVLELTGNHFRGSEHIALNAIGIFPRVIVWGNIDVPVMEHYHLP